MTLCPNEKTRKSREQGPPPGIFQEPAREETHAWDRAAQIAPRSKSAGKAGEWWYSKKAMPTTDDEVDEGYYTAWGAENYPGWLERRFHEAWEQEWFWCKLCKKWMTDEHKDGISHNKRLQWWLDAKRRHDEGEEEETPPTARRWRRQRPP